MFLLKAALTGDSLETLFTKIQRDLTNHKCKYITRGIIFIITGISTVILSAKMSPRSKEIIGLVLLLVGAFEFFLTLKSRLYGWRLLLSLLLIIVSIAALWQPHPLVMALLIALTILVTIEGLLETFIILRHHPVHYWGWIGFAGSITLTFATIMWMSMFGFNAPYLMPTIGTSLGFYGLLLLMMVWQTKY